MLLSNWRQYSRQERCFVCQEWCKSCRLKGKSFCGKQNLRLCSQQFTLMFLRGMCCKTTMRYKTVWAHAIGAQTSWWKTGKKRPLEATSLAPKNKIRWQSLWARSKRKCVCWKCPDHSFLMYRKCLRPGSCRLPTPLRLMVPFQKREVKFFFKIYMYLFIYLIHCKTFQAVKPHRFYVLASAHHPVFLCLITCVSQGLQPSLGPGSDWQRPTSGQYSWKTPVRSSLWDGSWWSSFEEEKHNLGNIYRSARSNWLKCGNTRWSAAFHTRF